jgi:phosphatidate cytidylyltransferase
VTAGDHRGPHKSREFVSNGSVSNLTLRIISAAVMAPIVIAIAYLGGWPFIVLCALAAGAILWEWAHLIAERAEAAVLVPGGLGLLGAAALCGLAQPGPALAAIAGGAVLSGLWEGWATRGQGPAMRSAWALGGVVYASAAFLGPALLRNDPRLGLVAILFLAATVWATDIFAYFCGRALGGPLLWPQVSPKKTWSGAVGGLAAGVAAGVLVAYASGINKLTVVGGIALVLSVLSQGGDLFESAIKRHFGAKDTSQLIPGHGGVMDRLDGFLVAALAALIIGLIRQGTHTPAQGLLQW